MYLDIIKKDYQGKHLSNLLMDKLLFICKENNCDTIFLEVNSINNKAINFFPIGNGYMTFHPLKNSSFP